MRFETVIGKFLRFEEKNLWTRITAPFRLPNGNLIDVYLVPYNGKFYLTDLGETKAFLKMKGKLSGFSSLIQDLLSIYEIEAKEGHLRKYFDRRPSNPKILAFATAISDIIASQFPEKGLFRFTPVFERRLGFARYSFSKLSRATNREVVISLTPQEKEEIFSLMEKNRSDIFQIKEMPGLNFTVAMEREIVIFVPEDLK